MADGTTEGQDCTMGWVARRGGFAEFGLHWRNRNRRGFDYNTGMITMGAIFR